MTLSRAEIDRDVARAWDQGCWTLAQFIRATKLPERTIEESCLRLYKKRRINFDPPDERQANGRNSKQPTRARKSRNTRTKKVKVRRNQGASNT